MCFDVVRFCDNLIFVWIRTRFDCWFGLVWDRIVFLNLIYLSLFPSPSLNLDHRRPFLTTHRPVNSPMSAPTSVSSARLTSWSSWSVRFDPVRYPGWFDPSQSDASSSSQPPAEMCFSSNFLDSIRSSNYLWKVKLLLSRFELISAIAALI